MISFGILHEQQNRKDIVMHYMLIDNKIWNSGHGIECNKSQKKETWDIFVPKNFKMLKTW